jgi:hypothetical protein
MADTRRLGSGRTRKASTSIKTIACSVLLVAAGAAIVLGTVLDKSAPVGERGDRIDFSSLATVVSIDEYVASEVKGLSSEYKDDRLGQAGVSSALAATSVVKVNFGASLDDADRNVPAMVAQHSAKLLEHLERGWNATTAARGDLAVAANGNLLGRPTSVSLLPASLNGRAGPGSRGGMSALAP